MTQPLLARPSMGGKQRIPEAHNRRCKGYGRMTSFFYTMTAILGESAMSIDLSQKSDASIEQFITNHQAKGVTNIPFYRELLDERARRASEKTSMHVDKSILVLRAAAVAGHCVAYGDLAEASGVPWNQARVAMNGKGGHLDQILDMCHAQGLPLLTAICVNKDNVETGELEARALAGFVEGAERLGISVNDPLSYHHAERDRVWEWGKTAE